MSHRNVFIASVFLLLSTISPSIIKGTTIHPHGYWEGVEAKNQHCFDLHLANALAKFFKSENAYSIVDFGCGVGSYVKLLLAKGFDCEGYDGNPATPRLSYGTCKVIDLSNPFCLSKHYDWVLSLEVGEHLPPEYQKTFIENLDRHNTRGIVLSWAVKGQGGFGHFNEQNNDYIKKVMASYGYHNDVFAERSLRLAARLPWFRNTIMVFRKGK